MTGLWLNNMSVVVKKPNATSAVIAPTPAASIRECPVVLPVLLRRTEFSLLKVVEAIVHRMCDFSMIVWCM
jgi:hypothetical protein